MKNTHLILLLLATLSACSSTKNVAPVEERQAGPRVVESVKPTPAATSSRAPDAHGYYTVKKGDTLIHIALNHGQNYRDLVIWNNLANPNDIKIDQTLRVLPPESGLTNGSVAVQAVPQPSLSNTDARASASGAQVVVNKNWPNGEKRPYSDSAMAEMQKNDAPVLAKVEPKKNVVKESGPSTTATTVASATTGGAITTPVAASAPSSAPASAPSASALSAEDERLTWIWPVEGKVIANFEEGKNKGIDIAGRAGQQVLAAGSGKVMYAGSGIRGYGNLVIVKHSNSLLSAYAHNQTILVKEGQTVNRGQTIAEMGSSDSETVKLHFEIRQQGKPVDPTRFLPSK